MQEATGENWFPVKEVKEKRSQIAKLIIHQAQAENEGKLVFPALRFESPVRRTSKRREMKTNWADTELEFLQEDPPSGRLTRSRERRALLGDGGHTGRLTRKTARAAATDQVNHLSSKLSFTIILPSLFILSLIRVMNSLIN